MIPPAYSVEPRDILAGWVNQTVYWILAREAILPTSSKQTT